MDIKTYKSLVRRLFANSASDEQWDEMAAAVLTASENFDAVPNIDAAVELMSTCSNTVKVRLNGGPFDGHIKEAVGRCLRLPVERNGVVYFAQYDYGDIIDNNLWVGVFVGWRTIGGHPLVLCSYCGGDGTAMRAFCIEHNDTPGKPRHPISIGQYFECIGKRTDHCPKCGGSGLEVDNGQPLPA